MRFVQRDYYFLGSQEEESQTCMPFYSASRLLAQMAIRICSSSVNQCFSSFLVKSFESLYFLRSPNAVLIFILGACGDSLGSVSVVGLLETFALSLKEVGNPNLSPLTTRYRMPIFPSFCPRMTALSTILHVIDLFALLARNQMMLGELSLKIDEFDSMTVSSLSMSLRPIEPMLTGAIYTIWTRLGEFNLMVSSRSSNNLSIRKPPELFSCILLMLPLVTTQDFLSSTVQSSTVPLIYYTRLSRASFKEQKLGGIKPYQPSLPKS